MGTTPIAPGSPEAVARGCQCPVLDNARGKGAGFHGQREYWISEGCPIHAGIAKSGKKVNRVRRSRKGSGKNGQ